MYYLCNTIIDIYIIEKTYLNAYTGDKNSVNKPVLVILGKNNS